MSIAAIVIGRNEGARLIGCLDALKGWAPSFTSTAARPTGRLRPRGCGGAGCGAGYGAAVHRRPRA